MRNDQAIKFKNLKRGQFLHSNFLYTDYTLDYTLASLERIGAKNWNSTARSRICAFTI